MAKRRNVEPTPHYNSDRSRTDSSSVGSNYKSRKFINNLLKYRNIIVSYLADKRNLPITELYKVIPVRILKKEIEILKYYKVIEQNRKYLNKGENYGKIDVSTLPLPCLLARVKPYEKVIYEVIKQKECYSIEDIRLTLMAYGLPCGYGVVQDMLQRFIYYGIIKREKTEFGMHVYKVILDLFIPPPTFEEKLEEAKKYRKEWERRHPNLVKRIKYWSDEYDF